MSTLRGHIQDFRPRFKFWYICHVDRHGHFSLKRLRLSLVNEVHTNSYTGPKLSVTRSQEILKPVVLIPRNRTIKFSSSSEKY